MDTWHLLFLKVNLHVYNKLNLYLLKKIYIYILIQRNLYIVQNGSDKLLAGQYFYILYEHIY